MDKTFIKNQILFLLDEALRQDAVIDRSKYYQIRADVMSALL